MVPRTEYAFPMLIAALRFYNNGALFSLLGLISKVLEHRYSHAYLSTDFDPKHVRISLGIYPLIIFLFYILKNVYL